MKKGILIWSVVLLISVAAFIYLLGEYNNKKTFVKPSFDENAVEGTPTVSEEMSYESLDAEGLYSVSLCGKPIIEDNKLKIYLTSSEDNNIYIKARVYKIDKVIGESGLIKPNEYIENIGVKNVKKGDTLTVKIMGYDKDNYYSAGVINVELVVE